MQAPAKILVADDQPDVLEALRILLKGEGYQVEVQSAPAAVIAALRAREFDVLLMDLNYARDTTSGQDGLDLLAGIEEIHSPVRIVVMTAWSTVGLAVETMRRGVRDFVQKPWENEHLLATLREQVLRGREDRERERRKMNELEQVREVERGLLPREMPRVSGFDFAALWRPAEAVGGDYFDIRQVDQQRVALSVGDVVGKGWPAALLMSNLQAAVRSAAADEIEPHALCSKVNRVIYGNVTPDKFITFFYALLDAGRRELVYTNAGHNAPVLIREDRTLSRLDAGGAVIGVRPDSHYEQGRVRLAPGDRVALFTDGITEAQNEAGDEFGEERLIETLIEHRRLGADDLHKALLASIAAHGVTEFQDDATLIVLACERQ